jgi:hypothetical protein
MSTDALDKPAVEQISGVSKLPELKTKTTRKRKSVSAKNETTVMEKKEALLDMPSGEAEAPTPLTAETAKKIKPEIVEKIVYVPQQLQKGDLNALRTMIRQEMNTQIAPVYKMKQQPSMAPLQDFMENRLLLLTNTLQALEDKINKLPTGRSSNSSASVPVHEMQQDPRFESFEDETMHNYHTGGTPKRSMKHNLFDYEGENNFSYF